MARLPLPPATESLARLSPDYRLVPTGTLLWRIYFRGGQNPTTWRAFRDFGPTRARFDHQLPPRQIQSRAIFYVATDSLTCIAEVFQQTRIVDLVDSEPAIVAFRTIAPLQLLDLSGHWPTTAGASMAINSGSHVRARAWSQAIYDAYPDAHGLWYCSSMNANAPALALYERAQLAIPTDPSFQATLADPRLRLLLYRHASLLNYQVIARH